MCAKIFVNFMSWHKGEHLLVYKHFIHRKESNEKTIWKCNDYKKLNCRCRVYTKGDNVITYTDPMYQIS